MMYIGETSQWLKTRINQHKRCCRVKDEKNGFALHLKEYSQHNISWETFEVSMYISKASNGGDLCKVLNIENGE